MSAMPPSLPTLHGKLHPRKEGKGTPLAVSFLFAVLMVDDNGGEWKWQSMTNNVVQSQLSSSLLLLHC